MEYNPDFLSSWYAQLPPAQPSTRRADVLERYAAKVNRTRERSEGLFLDVARIRLLLESSEAKQFEGICKIYGFQVSRHGKETSCKGPEIEILIRTFEPTLIRRREAESQQSNSTFAMTRQGTKS